MDTPSDSKFFTTTTVVFSSVLILQILVLIIFMIQLSDSKIFRIIVGFCGTGMSVVSIVMGMRSPATDKNPDGDPLKINLGNLKSPVMKYIWLGSLIFTVINLFISFFRDYKITHSIFESSAYTGTLVLTTSLLAFIIIGIRILIKNPAKDGKGFIIARIVLLILFIWMFYQIYPPVFFAFLSQFTGNTHVLGYVSISEFNFHVIYNIRNLYAWHISALVAFYCQYRFYYQFLWVENIRRAQEEKAHN